MKQTTVMIIFLSVFVMGGTVLLDSRKSACPAYQTLGEKDISACTAIQSGTLLDEGDRTIKTGFDEWGYNYQARLFNGNYCSANYDAGWCQGSEGISLTMKWNDAWLSNQDCDGDSHLDKHWGFDSYIGSGAWFTEHMGGSYLNEEGKKCHWNYFRKIVAAPADAYSEGGAWYESDGTKIGPEIWETFAIVQQIDNNPCGGSHGIDILSPAGPGLGKFK